MEVAEKNEKVITNTEVQKNKRIDYLDIAKGIGILSVIIGHTFDVQYLSNFLYSFHMPLFFVLSGYFFKEKDTKTIVKKGLKD